MKKLLILGASGFIGKNCLDFFANDKEYEITATYFSKNKYEKVRGVKYVKVDLREENQVKKILKNQDVVIQAAAKTTGSKDVIEKPYLHVTDNAVMNSWIFREAMLNNVKHLIFMSCTVMYQSKDYAQKESDWSASEDIYKNYFGVGNTKVYLEKMCEFYASISKTKFTAIRHSNVYGPYDKFDLDKCHVVPAFINKIINSKDTLEVWGDGRAKRDILYIDDLVKMIDLTIQKQASRYELFNCGSGKAHSIKELADIISKVNNKKLELKFDASKPNIPTNVILNCEKAKLMLGWSSESKMDESIKKTSEWYIKNYKVKV